MTAKKTKESDGICEEAPDSTQPKTSTQNDTKCTFASIGPMASPEKEEPNRSYRRQIPPGGFKELLFSANAFYPVPTETDSTEIRGYATSNLAIAANELTMIVEKVVAVARDPEPNAAALLWLHEHLGDYVEDLADVIVLAGRATKHNMPVEIVDWINFTHVGYTQAS